MRPDARTTLVCAAAMTIIGLLWMLSGDPAPESGAHSGLAHPEAPSVGTTRPVADAPHRQEHLADGLATVDGATLVVVRDPSGAPIVGADVRVVKSDATGASPRRLPVGTSGPTARCDDRGVATFLPTITPGHTLIASHASHAHAHHPVTAVKDRIDITLQPAATLRISCRTRDGKPLSGVRVSASSRPLANPPTDGETRLAPGPDPATAIHEAVSGGDGRAIVGGLLPGRVYVVLDHGTHVAAGLLRKQPISVAAGSVDLEESFDPIAGIHAAMSGDSIVTWNLRIPKSIVHDPRVIRSLGALTESLQSNRGDTLCFLGARRYDPKTGDYMPLPDNLRVTLLTDALGVVQAKVRPQTGPNLYSVQEIRLDTSRPAAPTELVSVLLLHADGSQMLDTSMCTLLPEDVELVGLSIPLPRLPVRLPLGSYTLRGHTAFLDRALGSQRIHVAAGVTQHAVTLTQPLVACRFLVNDDLGVEVDAADITIVHGDAKESFSCDHGLPTRVYHLPPGELKIQVVARGCKPVSLTTNLTEGEATKGATTARVISVIAPRSE